MAEKLAATKTKSTERRLGMRAREKEEFLASLSSLVSSGLGLTESFSVLAEEAKTRTSRELIVRVNADIEEGLTLSQSLERTISLPQDTTTLIRLGEESGKLAKNLEIIVTRQEKEQVFRSRVQSAMIYPMMVIILTLVIGLAMAWLVLPRLTTVFVQLNVTLPLVTRILIKVSDILRLYGIIIIPVFVVLVILVTYFIFVYERTKFIGQGFLMQFKPIRKLIQEIEVSRFGYMLGTLLQADITITDALATIERATTFRKYSRLYKHLRLHIDNGDTFLTSFTTYPKSRDLIPAPIQRIVATAERSGNLIQTLLNISQASDNRIDITTKNITVILEPILLVFVFLGVIFVAISIILPVYGLIGSL